MGNQRRVSGDVPSSFSLLLFHVQALSKDLSKERFQDNIAVLLRV